MPFVSRPRGLAVGELSGVNGAINGGEVNLSAYGFTGEWYDHYYNHKNGDISSYTLKQIQEYTEAARRKKIAWVIYSDVKRLIKRPTVKLMPKPLS